MVTHAARQVADHVRGKCEAYYFSSWLHGGKAIKGQSHPEMDARLARLDAYMAEAPLNGAVYHEMAFFEQAEYYPRLGNGST